MEARKITIVSTKTQKKSVIISGAETLEELKRDLREAGIDYDDMTFYEGTSKTELKTDESVLPKDVPYTNRTTGETKNTNELVFMLTNTNKKIRSGATMTRAEAYDAIKEAGLQDECRKKFGKNFTMCKTNELISFIESKKTVVTATPAPVAEFADTQVREALAILVNTLYDDNSITCATRDKIFDVLGDTPSTVSKDCEPDSNSPYSKNEIEDMFRGMC